MSPTSQPTVTAIMPVRNRGGLLIDNALRSLRWQTVGPAELEIVLSDYGSSAEYARELGELAERHGARVVRRQAGGPWNRSRALNVGIRAAAGRYVFAVDADVIYAPDFVEAVLECQEEAGGDLFAICMCRDLPESLEARPWQADEFPGLVAQAPYRVPLGTGACQFARRSFFHEVRGYDEGYRGWGQEDSDMVYRAKRFGLQLRWMHDKTAMLHQWHPSTKARYPVLKYVNDARFHLTKYVLKKNPLGWG